MDILLVLLGLVLCFLLVSAWQIMRSCRRSAACSGLRHADPAQPRRPLHWITLDECAELLARSSGSPGLVVLDLRSSRDPAPFPVPAAPVRRVRTSELEQVLASIPPNRSAAFYGASSLCVFMIETSAGMQGSAPFYILRAERMHGEAA